MAQREEHLSFAAMIETARTDAGITRDDLYDIYHVELGAPGKRDAFNDWFRGQSAPTPLKLDYLYRSLNIALERAGKRARFNPVFPPALVPDGGGAAKPKLWVARESNPKPTGHKSVVPEIAAA